MQTPAGYVPLGNFVERTPTPRVGYINRVAGNRVMTVSANVAAGVQTAKVQEDIAAELSKTDLGPGVTWRQLELALAPHGMRVTPPLLPREGKSVIGSLLEREPTLIPRYNSSLPEPLRDCGVVWGSGVSMFTGEAGSGPASFDQVRVVRPRLPAS